MTAPTQPTSIFTWANGVGAVKIDPGALKRQTGWVYDPGTGYGEYPKMEYVNNELYNTSKWVNYNKQVGDYFSSLLSKKVFSYSVLRLNNTSDTIINFSDEPIKLKFNNISINTSNQDLYNDGVFISPTNGMFSFSVNLNLKVVGQNISYDPQGLNSFLNTYHVSMLSLGETAPSPFSIFDYGSGLLNFEDYDRNQVSTNRTAYLNINYTKTIKLQQGDKMSLYNFFFYPVTRGPGHNTFIITLLKNSKMVVTWDSYQYFYNG